MSEGLGRVRIVRVANTGSHELDDTVAIEEPLEVRLHGKSFAVIMRTPGSDRELAAGFLLSEDVIATADDVGAVEHCRHPQYPDRHNVVDVFLIGDARERVERRLAERRQVVASSSCGLCGRVTIESLERRCVPLTSSWTIDAQTVGTLPALLRARQRMFDETGGLHAAGLVSPAGQVLAVGEDVGRHNAVDKVIGGMLLENRLPLSDAVMMVSGRASFEIVQKAWIGGVGLVCAVSAPSSLAIDLAVAAGITLLGFVRHGGFNVYSHPERIRPM